MLAAIATVSKRLAEPSPLPAPVCTHTGSCTRGSWLLPPWSYFVSVAAQWGGGGNRRARDPKNKTLFGDAAGCCILCVPARGVRLWYGRQSSQRDNQAHACHHRRWSAAGTTTHHLHRLHHLSTSVPPPLSPGPRGAGLAFTAAAAHAWAGALAREGVLHTQSLLQAKEEWENELPAVIDQQRLLCGRSAYQRGAVEKKYVTISSSISY